MCDAGGGMVDLEFWQGMKFLWVYYDRVQLAKTLRRFYPNRI
jgi:hypothetical protein